LDNYEEHENDNASGNASGNTSGNASGNTSDDEITYFDAENSPFSMIDEDDIKGGDGYANAGYANDSFKETHTRQKTLSFVIDVTIKELYHECGKKLKIKCKGHHNDVIHQTIYISFDPYTLKYTFNGLGDWDSTVSTYGDVVVTLNIVEDNEYSINTILDRYELIRTIEIDLYEYYYGVSMTLDHYGDSIDIKHTPYTDGLDIYVPNFGLRMGNGIRGGLYIILVVVHEKTINIEREEVRRLIEQEFHGFRHRE
jgi:DnaJ-class molecular chaperone